MPDESFRARPLPKLSLPFPSILTPHKGGNSDAGSIGRRERACRVDGDDRDTRGVDCADGASAVQSVSSNGRRQAEPHRHLAGDEQRQLGHPGARRRGRVRLSRSARRSDSSRPGRRRGQRDSVSAGRRGKEERKLRQLARRAIPRVKCYLPGVPRATYMPFPFQIVQSANTILMAYEFATASRIVQMNSRRRARPTAWMGWSIGRWDGDTLVDRRDGSDGRDLVRSRRQLHSDALHVVERYTVIESRYI